MIKEEGRIVATDDHYAWVLTYRESACQSCSARSGCGNRVLRKLGGSEAQQIKVFKSLDVAVGDEVLVGIAEEGLMRASLLVYLLPLTLLVIFSAIADTIFVFSEVSIVLAGFSGLLTGFFIVKILSSKLSCNPVYHPQLLTKVSS